jgi:hypothetical protein
MLSYNDQYNILAGIYFTFTNGKSNKRTLSVNHGKAKRDKMKGLFPYKNYELWTKENFIIASLYIMFTNKPSSFITACEMLTELDEKKAMEFKTEIIHYRKFLKEDIEKLILENGTSLNLEIMKSYYRKNTIKWYTFYFYIVVSNQDRNKIKKSKIDGFLLKNIEKLLLYITFSEKSMMEVKALMQDNIEI